MLWAPTSALSSARLPVNLIGSPINYANRLSGSPINYANRLSGSPITSQSTGADQPACAPRPTGGAEQRRRVPRQRWSVSVGRCQRGAVDGEAAAPQGGRLQRDPQPPADCQVRMLNPRSDA